MSKFLVLLKQSYLQKVIAKSFILMTCLYLIGISAFIFWNDIVSFFSDDEAEQVAIINATNIDLSNVFMSTEELMWVPTSTLEEAKEQIKEGDFTAAMQLTEQEGKLKVLIVSEEPLQLTMQSNLENTANTAAQFFTMGKMNLTQEQSQALLTAFPILESETLSDEVESGKSTAEKTAGMWASYVSGFIIYIFVIMYLSMITTDIASEKGSRALEMLLVNVRPETHFKAKVTSVILVALTQLAVVCVFLFGLVKFVKDGEIWDSFVSVVNDLSISYVIYIVLFLISTIFLYLIIGALFGSLVSKVEEASQVMSPAVIMTVISLYIMISGLSNPDTMLIKISSYFPLTSGMVMPMRIGATDMPNWEPLLSFGLLIVTIIVTLYFAMTLYKRSVLTYSTGGLLAKIKSVFKYST